MNINEYEINNLTDKEEVGQVRSIDFIPEPLSLPDTSNSIYRLPIEYMFV